MAAPADYWDTADLKALAAGGLVNEDVMQQIWDISRIPLPFTDRISSGPVSNSYTEWTEDGLEAPNINNAVVSGADAAGNDAKGGNRLGNHCQNSVKVLQVTERAQSTDQVGRSDELAYQLMMRQQELRRDVEAIMLSEQASVQDDNNTTAGKSAGFSAFLKSNTVNGATGADGGFNTTTKVVDAADPGDGAAASFGNLKDLIESVYLNNGNVSVLMSVPQVTRRLGEFLLTNASAAKVAVPTANVSGTAPANQVAQGYVDVLITDFGTTLEIVPNRLQQLYNSTDTAPVPVATLYLIDTANVGQGILKGYQTKPLAKLGLSERAQISVDWCLRVYVEKAHAAYRGILPTSAWVA